MRRRFFFGSRKLFFSFYQDIPFLFSHESIRIRETMQPDMINTPDGIANVVDSPSLMSHSNEDASVHDNEPLTNGSDRLDSHPELNERDSSHVDARTEAHAQADADAGANAEVQEVQNNTSSHRSSSSSQESTTEPSSNPNHNHKLAPSSSQSLSSSSSSSTSTLTSTASSSSSSSTPSLPRRCPVPPSLKFEGTVLPDIGEEDDVKSQAGGNGNNGFVMVTPGASSSGGLRTPQLPDDASTVFTNDDESEYASENDLGSRAERRLESAKRRLTVCTVRSRDHQGQKGEDSIDRFWCLLRCLW